MTMNNNENYPELEIDLREYILLLWRKKWIIIGLVILAILAAYIYSIFMIDINYKLSSDVLVFPPVYTEIDVANITFSTYRSLARSDRVLNNIIEELDLKDEDGNLLSPSNIRNKMEVNVGEENGFEEGSAILFQLVVTGGNPEKTANIANTWSELFKEDILDIRQSETEDIYRVTSRRLEETESRLEAAQEVLQNILEEYRPDRLETSKNVYDEQIEIIEKNLHQLEEELGVKKSQKQQLQKNLAQMRTENGQWLGDLSREEDLTFETDLFSPIENLLKLERRLLSFWEENKLEQLEQELKHITENLEIQRSLLEELEILYFTAQSDFVEIEVLLEEEPDKFELSRGISEEALWHNLLSQENIEALSGLSIIDEEINPVYQELRQLRADNFVSINSVPRQIEHISERIDKLQQRESEYRSNLQQLKFKESALKKDIGLYESIYDVMQGDYQDLVTEEQNLAREIASIESRINYYQTYHQELLDKVSDIETQIWEADRMKDRLQREVSEYERSYESLSSRAEDARLAQAEQTSDVRFVAEAVPPGDVIGRGTTLNMAIAAVLAGMLGVFGVFFREFLKDEDDFKAD